MVKGGSPQARWVKLRSFLGVLLIMGSVLATLAATAFVSPAKAAIGDLNLDENWCKDYPLNGDDAVKRGPVCKWRQSAISTRMEISPVDAPEVRASFSSIWERGIFDILRFLDKSVFYFPYLISCNLLQSTFNSNYSPTANTVFSSTVEAAIQKLKGVPDDQIRGGGICYLTDTGDYKLGDPTVVTKTLLGQGTNPWVKSLFEKMRIVLNILLVVLLLIAAFANILHIQLDTYAVKKALPSVIAARSWIPFHVGRDFKSKKRSS